jgi:hypothetical protein
MRRLRIVQDEKLLGDDFNFSGRHLGIDGRSIPAPDVPNRGDDILRTNGFGTRCRVSRNFSIEHHLRDAGAVAQIEKKKIAVVAAPVDPAHQDYVLVRVRVRRGEQAAVVRAFESAEKVELHGKY